MVSEGIKFVGKKSVGLRKYVFFPLLYERVVYANKGMVKFIMGRNVDKVILTTQSQHLLSHRICETQEKVLHFQDWR